MTREAIARLSQDEGDTDSGTVARRDASIRLGYLGSDREPFNIVGELHGCFDELRALPGELGWAVARGEQVRGRALSRDPRGWQRLMFLGDLVDAGRQAPTACGW